ncbi:MAG: hypothetical protein ACO1OC_09730 [Tuberibacillus sp.]
MKKRDEMYAPPGRKKKLKLQSVLYILVASFLTALLLYFYNHQDETEQSLTYFPDDPMLAFAEASTTLKMQSDDRYTIQWKVHSVLNTETYLRQDVSFLYKDQRLIGVLTKWKENTSAIAQSRTIPGDESGFYEAISVHHAESHYPNNIIRGKEVMSFDRLSVLKMTSGFIGFNIPESLEQEQWYKKRWETMQLKQKALIAQAARQYHFNPDEYYQYPLSHIPVYNNESLPGLDQKTTHRVISQLWEGLYKGYALGIHLTEHETKSPLGSSMPIILYHKKADHLLLITQLHSGEIAMLRQQL